MSSPIATMHLTQQPATIAVKAEAREAIEEAIERTLSAPEFSAQITVELKNLGKTVRDIRRGFRAVADDLVSFDDHEYKDKDGKVLRLRPLWLGYLETFDDILKRSRRNAIAASSMIRQYTQAILTDVDPSEFEDIRDELRGFLKASRFNKIDRKALAAQQTEGELTELAGSVRSFRAVVDNTIYKAQGRCISDINKATSHLESLEQNIQSINNEKTELGFRALDGLYLLGGTCALFTMFVCAPSAEKVFTDLIQKIGLEFGVPAAILAGYCGLQGWLLHQQGTEHETEMEECRIDLVHKEKRHNDLLGHTAALVQTKEKITALAKKVDTITLIWTVLKSDMQELQEQLAWVADPDMEITKRFLKKLRCLRQVYSRLADLLELYAKRKFELS
ncbi:hypothetical protein GSI_07787 [Ganoderma sinense ZZ0214-1]|uniref:Uncharacterized protein n=1 Tax=Ganoderma sinense ZZ0214-1 TaxID=1077348 RepID=A0A2G8S8G6_9APHY|nr:hypothetical protein GSI_07647 [Ganoderma sinense ZZ0214-1]PIL30209.1 hypothetical protein GSI_07787 [Ganoderma sinense ZZ0214-1]